MVRPPWCRGGGGIAVGGGAIIIQTATVRVFERICYGQSR